MTTLVRMKARANTRTQLTDLRPAPDRTSPVWVATEPVPNNANRPHILLARSLDLHQPDLRIRESPFRPKTKIAVATKNPSARNAADAELKAAL